jgi:hypothetical protein
MKPIGRYNFTNDKSFETYYLSKADTDRLGVPECDALGLRQVIEDDARWLYLRPDEALILARLLIDAVHQTCEGFTVTQPT